MENHKKLSAEECAEQSKQLEAMCVHLARLKKDVEQFTEALALLGPTALQSGLSMCELYAAVEKANIVFDNPHLTLAGPRGAHAELIIVDEAMAMPLERPTIESLIIRMNPCLLDGDILLGEDGAEYGYPIGKAYGKPQRILPPTIKVQPKNTFLRRTQRKK